MKRDPVLERLRALDERAVASVAADLTHMLYWRLATKLVAASSRVLDLSPDDRLLRALENTGRRPREYAHPGLKKGAPSWATNRTSGGYDLVASLGLCPVSLAKLKKFGAPGARYLVHGPKRRELERAGFVVERAIGLDLPLEVAREVLAPPAWRAMAIAAKLYGEDVARALFAPVAPDGECGDRALFILRDAKRSEKPKPDLVEKESVKQIYRRGAEAAAAAAKRRRDDRAGSRARPGTRDVDHGEGRRAQRVGHSAQGGRDHRVSRGRGIGAFIRERILAKEDPAKTLAEVHRRWPESTAKMSDWHWNRRKLVSEGAL